MKKISYKKNYLWKGQPLKILSFGLKNTGGRNNFGRICSFKKGGGMKRKYRSIDFNRNIINIPGIIRRIEYDPNRTAYIALVCYKNGFLSYILAIEGLFVGDQIINHDNNISLEDNVNSKLGHSLPLKYIPNGTYVNSIELFPGFGSIFTRSAGTFAIIFNKYVINSMSYILVKLSSGEEYLIPEGSKAVIGIISNSSNCFHNLKRAGVSRNKGIRPSVRGVAMNPVDHPHGGGEGKKSGKCCAMSPWGKLCKGKKTRNKLLINPFILKKRIK